MLRKICRDKRGRGSRSARVRELARRGAFDLQQIIQRLHPAARPVELNFHRELRSSLTGSEAYIYTGYS